MNHIYRIAFFYLLKDSRDVHKSITVVTKLDANKIFEKISHLSSFLHHHNSLSTMPSITTPTLLLDKDRCLRNIQNMADKAKAAGVRLRPHCKTHASGVVAQWLRDCGDVTAITVSSLTMAKYFAQTRQWSDITVAFPVNILEIDAINKLVTMEGLESPLQLNLLVENVEAVQFLAQHLAATVGIYVKVDVGYGRTGIPVLDFDRYQASRDSIATAAVVRPLVTRYLKQHMKMT